MFIQDLHPDFSVPGGSPQNARSKFKPSGVSVIFLYLKMTNVVSCRLCHKNV